jgi:2,4-dienoyl-CoA reductase-like NADH-dependent reductase (Old Yellow Enzyme family)
MSHGANEIVSWTDQIQIGDLNLHNRVFMAAMSRVRCDPKDGIATDLVAKYYAQRAGAGLIIT